MDRFGDIPKPTNSLIMVSHIKAMAEDLDIRRVKVVRDRLILDYGSKSPVQPLTLFLTGGREVLAEVEELLSIMKKKTEEAV